MSVLLMDDAEAFKTTDYCVWGRHWNMCRHIVLCVPILACYVCSTQQLTSRVRFISLVSGTCHVLLSDNRTASSILFIAAST